MKAKITSKTYYIAETSDGKKYSVDIRNPQIKHAFDNNLEIEGDIFREERQDRYTNGEYARSYTVIEKFIPKKEKITLGEETTILGKYDMKFGKGFTEDMEQIRKEIAEEEKSKTKVQPQHIALPKKDSK
jgi:hypothetical protein